MPTMEKRWLLPTPIPPETARALGKYPPPIRQILYNRRIETEEAAQRFLGAERPADTDPFHLTGMASAVQRIERALRDQELIAVYGDYDADGVTATALLVQVLQRLNARVKEYIPNRFEEGYGLNQEALRSLRENGYQLVITVDCGVRSIEEAHLARKIGLDLIISDHHHPANELPDTIALINPKQPGDGYPFKELAGVGLAYKIAQALFQRLSERGSADAVQIDPDQFWDLVAIGTIADLAPLVDENRYLVRRGLKAIRMTQRQGLMSLIGVAGLRPARVSAGDIGFVLGPRLNAAGRLESALAAYELLLTEDLHRAGQLAQQLDVQNRDRQRITREIQAAAGELALAQDPDALLLFAAHKDFNSGVVGLAASRLTEQYYRPAIVAQIGETHTRGSCRSIPEFHITDALDQCKDLLERHGGHSAAAGFTIQNENLEELTRRIQLLAREKLSQQELVPRLQADMHITLKELRAELLEFLDLLEPTGIENPPAFFISRNLKVLRYKMVGEEGKHLKLTVSDGMITYDAIAFQFGYWADQMPSYIDLMYSFEKNEYNGRESLQLRVKDLKAAGTPD